MNAVGIKSKILGYPRIGKNRELKKATESYWKGDLSLEQLKEMGHQLRKENWMTQKEAGIDLIPSNDFSFYDQVLDMTCLLGNIPQRFYWNGGDVDLDMLFFLARGLRPGALQLPTSACEMTKWFDTNYHYIVPELSGDTTFRLSTTKVFDEFQEALDLGIITVPVLIGPVTYLLLGKNYKSENFDPLVLLERLLPLYEKILKKLAAQGAKWVQIDEPCFALDLTLEQKQALIQSYRRLSNASNLKIMVATYFGEVQDNLDTLVQLSVDGIHVDAVRAPQEVKLIAQQLSQEKILSIGIVDGRNIWRNDYNTSLRLLQSIKKIIGRERLIVSSSCSLIHAPIGLKHEDTLDAEIKSWLAFAEEKIVEVADLAQLLSSNQSSHLLIANQKAIATRYNSPRINQSSVRERQQGVAASDLNRGLPFARRQTLQMTKLGLPLFPTTTIGSFPQTADVRAARAKYKHGAITQIQYEDFLKEQINNAVRLQEEIGIDMLVHGEFERNDMVEYFGEQLAGFVFTARGWVQSYGSRYVKPPIIFGDVYRPKPMTVAWSAYAQSLTNKPMKGMLTGPVTIAQWSFIRDDQPRSQTVQQIALAIRDEVQDLEKVGLAAIQIDEPALREGLPLRKSEWTTYLKWAVDAFKLSCAVVKYETQIHTHMCYSEFNDIIEAIAAMDADVISIETSRSNMELLNAFETFKYPNEIGPGVYDIHSPRVPSVSEMTNLLSKAIRLLPAENIWVNPDCGLKTRQWPETKEALKNMVAAARQMRVQANAAI